ncbi:LuxR C-terminal-related transcriptional regulator [Streptomyces sp. MNP-20]|uniref:helix-turn-helix transcriptional regulator n=1 Tax=Streptomyces sp. MNP-20 TaxID=2721165 RepID=UPI001555418D|nr:LuxR C-terminal-related transcriptional regulator [Streptomyces sp. MNP-20]
MARDHSPHGAGELCGVGRTTYVRALQDGGVPAADADRAPCVVDLGLLRPDPRDASRLLPVAPSVALPRLLHALDADVTDERARQRRLAEVFAPLMTLGEGQFTGARAPGATVLKGLSRINAAIDHAAAGASREALAIQPGGRRVQETLEQALPRADGLLSRGGRMRSLYPHTGLHACPVYAYFQRLDGDVEARTLTELPGRLLVFDRSVAFIPAGESRDVALRIHQPAVISYLVTTFKLLWQLATPMWPDAAPEPPRQGITPRQLAIAELLTEGLTDTEIAARLGMNVRTARVHIAKLSAVLHSQSRAQLGYLIGQSGILGEGRA